MSNFEDFNKFMNQFVNEYLARPTNERIPPFRLIEDVVKVDEIPGYCCEWTAQYLHSHQCPVYWLNVVCKETINQIADVDISEFLESDTDEKSLPADQYKYVDAKKLCERTFRTVEELITQWLTNFPTKWGKTCSSHRHKISYHAIKNTRRKMEDRHNVVPLLNVFTDREDYKDSSLYAVFDGHGGPEASCYASAQFLFNLIKEPSKDKSEALLSTYRKTDIDFSTRAVRQGLRSGTTGVAVLIEPDVFHISWLGDSQAILVRSGHVVNIMSPHKPEATEERARIEGLGGCVVFFGTWRVNGNLAVSRAIGDVDHKPYISSEADVSRVELDGSEEYLIVACDGLWDTVSPNTAMQLVYDHIQSGKTHSSVAEMLVRSARDEGSGDNITVIVIFLKENLCVPVPGEEVEENKIDNNPESDEEEDSDNDSTSEGGETL